MYPNNGIEKYLTDLIPLGLLISSALAQFFLLIWKIEDELKNIFGLRLVWSYEWNKTLIRST